MTLVLATAVMYHNGLVKFFLVVLLSCQKHLHQSMMAIDQLSTPSSTIDLMFNSIPTSRHLLDQMQELKLPILLEQVSRILTVQLLTITFCWKTWRSVKPLNVLVSKLHKCRLNLMQVLLRLTPKEKHNKKLSNNKTQVIPPHNFKGS